VVDASHPRVREQMDAVHHVLRELSLEDRPALVAVNKIDRLAEPDGVVRALVDEGGVAVSARTGQGLDALRRRIEARLHSTRRAWRLRVPYARSGVLSVLYERGRVLEREDHADGIRLRVELPAALAGLVAPYRTDGMSLEADEVHTSAGEAVR
jgi:GTP-binding protein HflX